MIDFVVRLVILIYVMGAAGGGIIYLASCLKVGTRVDYLALGLSMLMWPKVIEVFFTLIVTHYLKRIMARAGPFASRGKDDKM